MIRKIFIFSISLLLYSSLFNVQDIWSVENDPESIVKQFLSFWKVARCEVVNIPYDPYYDFQLQNKFIKKFDTVYDTIEFEKDYWSRKDFSIELFLIPILDYQTLKVKEKNKTDTIITAEVQLLDWERFYEECGLNNLWDAEFDFEVDDNESKEKLKYITNEFVEEFERNYSNAIKGKNYTDTLIFSVRKIDNKWKIIWPFKSELEENEKAKKIKNVTQIINNLELVDIEISDYRDQDNTYGDDKVYIKGIIKNNSGIDTNESLIADVELLDNKGNTISQDTGHISALKANALGRFIAAFKDYQVWGWEGSYRLRFVWPEHDAPEVYSPWILKGDKNESAIELNNIDLENYKIELIDYKVEKWDEDYSRSSGSNRNHVRAYFQFKNLSDITLTGLIFEVIFSDKFGDILYETGDLKYQIIIQPNSKNSMDQYWYWEEGSRSAYNKLWDAVASETVEVKVDILKVVFDDGNIIEY